ncbi:hypothetical protein RJT34_16647 [Clitoria ternatea]|uniref:Uncharacterized protein n=1 Tax=Clitoria ternatea TaxID=43366 RepID=A0AAN9J8Q2_CLITE
MVYNGAIDRIIGRPPPKTGNIVLVSDGTEKPIEWGLYNFVSMFYVRLMQVEDKAIRIGVAIELRRRLGLPSVHTNAYRLINSEGDRWMRKQLEAIKGREVRGQNKESLGWLWGLWVGRC